MSKCSVRQEFELWCLFPPNVVTSLVWDDQNNRYMDPNTRSHFTAYQSGYEQAQRDAQKEKA